MQELDPHFGNGTFIFPRGVVNWAINLGRQIPTMIHRVLLRRTTAQVARFALLRRFFRGGSGPLLHGYKNADVDPETAVRLTFVTREGDELKVSAPEGASLLDIAHANDVELEGACEGSLACSTCHVYLDEETFDKLEEPCDDENDMLDLAFALKEKYVSFLPSLFRS